MSDHTFAELMMSAEQSLAYERGARDGYRTTQLAVPKHKNIAKERQCNFLVIW
jgi:hypothetical protein